jgi:lipid A 4'-phosphatase
MNNIPRPALLCLSALGLSALIFGLIPSVDVAFSALFFDQGHFFGHTLEGRVLRQIGLFIPIAVLIGVFITWVLALCGFIKAKLSHKLFAYLILTMALGPGLLVNVILKDHSHRPRPISITAFDGGMEFRPWYSFDGACERNCSFVSGETASAVWLVAPALLVPAPVQPFALAGAGLFAATISLMRIAYGAHFLSDVIFSALLTLLIIFMGLRWAQSPPHNRES